MMDVLDRNDDCMTCPHERVHRVEYQKLTEDIVELKERVVRLESTLARGLLLLVANLVGVAMSFAQLVLTS